MTYDTIKTEEEQLSKLNKQFINNFINGDADAHAQLIHKDFVCIENNGSIVTREEYLKNWTTGYLNSGYSTFSITDEYIRIFGDVALIRSRTVYTKIKDGKEVSGNSIYTDTYYKENGRWWCVQAQITPMQK